MLSFTFRTKEFDPQLGSDLGQELFLGANGMFLDDWVDTASLAE
jgi:hypothetical protein